MRYRGTPEGQKNPQKHKKGINTARNFKLGAVNKIMYNVYMGY